MDEELIQSDAVKHWTNLRKKETTPKTFAGRIHLSIQENHPREEITPAIWLGCSIHELGLVPLD